MPPHPPRSGPGGPPSAIQASMAALGLDDPAWMPREIKSTLPPLKLTLDGSSSGRWVAPPPKPDVDLSALQSADIPGGLYVALDGHAGSANLRSLDAFNTFGPGKASGIVGQQLELDHDEGKYKDEEDINAWRPREIKSTLPPLEIKEIPSTLPPLKISSSSAAGSSSAKSRTPLPAGPAVASSDGKLAPVNTRPKAPDLLSTIAAAILEETYDPGLGAIYDIPAEDRGVYITLTPLQGGGRNDFGAMAGAGAIGGTLELYSNAKGDTTEADWAKSAQASVGWQSEVAKLAAKSGGSTSAAPAADTEIPVLPPPWAVPLPPPPSRSKAAPTSSSSSLPSLPSPTPPPSLISIDAAPTNPPVSDTTLISPVELPTTMPPLRLDVPTSIRLTPDMKPVAPRPPLPAGSSLAASTKPPVGQQPPKTVAVMPFDAVNHEVVDFDRGVYIALAPLETDPEDGLESKGDTFGANYGLHLVGGQLEISEAPAKAGVTSLKEQVEREARAREEKMRREWDSVGGFGNYGAKADARVSATVGEVPLDTVAELAGLGEQPRGMYVPVDPGTAEGRRVVSLIGRKIDDDDERAGTKSGKVAESALPSIPPPPSFSVSAPTFVPPIPYSLTTSYDMASGAPGVLVALPGATVIPEDVVELSEDLPDRGMYVALEDVTGNDDGGDGLGGPRHTVHAVIGRKLSIEG